MSIMKFIAQHNNKQHGFTLVEMMVIAPLLILMIGAVVVSIVGLTGDSLAEGGKAQLINDVQGALDRIEADTRASGAYLSTNNFVPTYPQGVDGLSQKFVSVSGGQDSLILNTFVTTTNPMNSTRSLVYIPNTPYACGDPSIAQNQVMTMNVVYFVQNSTLWRRTLAPSTYASKPCAGVTIWQQPSCAEDKMSMNLLCKSQDEKVLEDVSPDDFAVLYFAAPADIAGSPSSEDADPTVRQLALDQSPTVQISLTGKRTVAGRDLSQQGTVRVTRTGTLVKYATPL